MNKISIKNLQKKIKINSRKLKTLANNVLRSRGIDSGELSIVLVDDPQITDLHKRYLNKNSPTDVLAFRMSDGEFGKINPQILGDVILSVETAQSQASRLKLSIESEVNLYLIHGILHLLGFSDKTKLEFKQMKKMQEELMERYA
ncbi:MAG: rRNA maturation RNase YbeY [Candidatus Omnitrophica bacterium]|nr:rRNA maturation RNase YbeY [Candidatus Omnitrophota bacterium]